MNIPIYRAKKIDGDEWIESETIFTNKEITRAVIRWTYGEISGYIGDVLFPIIHIVDPKTLSIHFPNMVDKNNKKIFASLSKDGVGGDRLTDGYGEKYTCIFSKITNSCVMRYETIQLQTETMGVYDGYWKTFEVVGIK